MGLFLSMSGIIGSGADSVIRVLRAYAESNRGSLEDARLTPDQDDCLVISETKAGVTLLYPGNFFEWDGASQFLSAQLNKPVFSFHIHDGDLWMYLLYENGVVIDQFNPIPDYWNELDEEERDSWRGNAVEVVGRVPGLSEEHISKYLVQWGDDVLESGERKKAYPTDQFCYGDDWQLVDFMDKLGLDYPVDDSGELRGVSYRFKCKQ